MTDEQAMQRAIAQARAGMRVGQSPFGAVIVRGDQVIAAAHNRVLADTDPTAHAETRCIRLACAAIGRIDLGGCTIFSTTEPCPMCFAACHWARLDRIVYGATIADARAAGFNELAISNDQLKRQGGSAIHLTGGLLARECADLFQQWLADPAHRAY